MAQSPAKQCRTCGQLLPLDSFYRHARMRDGHLNHCVQCVWERVARHRSRNLDRIREYDRERGHLPHRQAQLRAMADRHMADPVKRHATRTTTNAIRDGKLVRPDRCSACGTTCRPEAHHDDYSRPLDVRWLCRSCHCKHHKAEAGQASPRGNLSE